MEYVDGVNLRQAIQSGGVDPKEALAIVPQICDALQFAHDEGIVHRDIKPENILVDKRGRVKIADFGLAKLLGRSPGDVALTATQQVMGTLRYMAPEQMHGTKAVDHRADIYSLGVVFYELLTGELPIGRFAPPSKKVEIDVRLDEVVLRALENEPEQRYQHASEVKTDVEDITRQEGPSAVPSASTEVKSGREAIRSSPRSAPSWFGALGLSGKLLSLGGLAGLVVAFFPLVSVSVQLGGPGGGNVFEMAQVMGGGNQAAMSVKTVLVAEDWRGKLGLAGYLVAIVLALVLYPPNGLGQKALCWIGVGTGLLVAVLAIWALASALSTGSTNIMGMGSITASVGIGAFPQCAGGHRRCGRGFSQSPGREAVRRGGHPLSKRFDYRVPSNQGEPNHVHPARPTEIRPLAVGLRRTMGPRLVAHGRPFHPDGYARIAIEHAIVCLFESIFDTRCPSDP